jgi:hypothetical protein
MQTSNSKHNSNNIKKIIHEIRNIRFLDNNSINDINKMSHDEKMEIILTFNIVLDTLKTNYEALI